MFLSALGNVACMALSTFLWNSRRRARAGVIFHALNRRHLPRAARRLAVLAVEGRRFLHRIG